MTKDEIRERLVELISQVQDCGCDVTNVVDMIYVENTALADHLLTNSVTVQEWIPVTERKPELIPNNAGTAYSEAVNVLTSGRKVMTAVWDGTNFICPMAFWEAWCEEITHWTPVLLPLPEAPKEVEQ